MPAVLRLAVSRPKTVLVVAALVAVLASVFSAGVVGKLKTGGFDDPDSAHVRGTTVLNERFRTASPNLVVTVEKPGGNVDDPDAVEAGKAVTDRLRETANVTLVGSYWAGGGTDLRSRQGDAGLVLARVAGDEDASADRTAALHDALARTGGPVRVRFGGLTQLNNDLNDQVTADLAKAESIAIPITLILLLIVFGTVIAAGVPLVVGLISILGTLGALSGIAALTDVSVFAVNLTTALGLGLAVDYSLLFVSRYREERARLGAGPAAPPDGD